MNFNERVALFDKTMQGYGDFTDLREWLITQGFFQAPASTKYHGNYEGGLFDHSYNVLKFLECLTVKNALTWGRPQSPYIIGMFHDLCKYDQYIKTEDGYEYNEERLLKGHGDKSVTLLCQFMPLTIEEQLCIRYHMGAFTPKEEWNDYTRAIHVCPNVLWTHHADMLASHVLEVQND